MAVKESLSILGLVAHASIPVQLVMLALAAASVYSWALIIRYRRVHKLARQEHARFEEAFWSGNDLGALYQKSQQNADRQGSEAVFHAGFKEFIRLRQKGLTAEAQMQGVTRAMRVTLASGSVPGAGRPPDARWRTRFASPTSTLSSTTCCSSGSSTRTASPCRTSTWTSTPATGTR